MSINLLTFELNQKDTGALLEIENKMGTFDHSIQLNRNSWLIESSLNSAQILNQFADYFDSDDAVFVFVVSEEWEAAASFEQHTWLEERL